MPDLFWEGKRIKGVEKRGKYKLIIIEGGVRHPKKTIKKIEFACSGCAKMTRRNFQISLLEMQEILCRSCWMSGERNHFHGKRHTEETLQRMRGDPRCSHRGKDNPFYGRKHKKESIQKIIEANARYRERQTSEEKQAIGKKRRASLRRFADENQEKWIASKRKAAHISCRSQRRYKKNKIETMFHEMLEAENIEVIYSPIMGSFQYDFLHKESRTLFEINGDYWHANPRFYGEGKKPLNEVQIGKVRRDAEKLAFAEERGFSVVKIWEYELYNQHNAVLERVKDAIKV